MSRIAPASGACELHERIRAPAPITRLSSPAACRARARARPRGSALPSISASAARTRQSRSGSSPDSTKVNVSGSMAAAARSAAARMRRPAVGEQVLRDGEALARLHRAQRGHRLEPHVGVRRRTRGERGERARSRAAVNQRQRADGADHDLDAAPWPWRRAARSAAARPSVLQHAETAGRERGGVAARNSTAAAARAPPSDPPSAAARRRPATRSTPADLARRARPRPGLVAP